MIAALLKPKTDEGERGLRILKNVDRLLKAKKATRNKEQGLDPDEFNEFQEVFPST